MPSFSSSHHDKCKENTNIISLTKKKLFQNINKLNKHDMTWNYSKWWTKLIAITEKIGSY